MLKKRVEPVVLFDSTVRKIGTLPGSAGDYFFADFLKFPFFLNMKTIQAFLTFIIKNGQF